MDEKKQIRGTAPLSYKTSKAYQIKFKRKCCPENQSEAGEAGGSTISLTAGKQIDLPSNCLFCCYQTKSFNIHTLLLLADTDSVAVQTLTDCHIVMS